MAEDIMASGPWWALSGKLYQGSQHTGWDFPCLYVPGSRPGPWKRVPWFLPFPQVALKLFLIESQRNMITWPYSLVPSCPWALGSHKKRWPNTTIGWTPSWHTWSDSYVCTKTTGWDFEMENLVYLLLFSIIPFNSSRLPQTCPLSTFWVAVRS